MLGLVYCKSKVILTDITQNLISALLSLVGVLQSASLALPAQPPEARTPSEAVFGLQVSPNEIAGDQLFEYATTTARTLTVPFYSQFKDISDPGWKKLGCGIASLAMLIEYYEPGEVSVDELLSEGIASGAYLNNAGWIHSGLAHLANDHGLSGMNYDLSSNDAETAFAQFEDALKEGPLIASVYYTFTPGNPIPHLVVINDIEGDTIYYNDPSDTSGGGTISKDRFIAAWKKRYIEVRPTT